MNLKVNFLPSVSGVGSVISNPSRVEVNIFGLNSGFPAITASIF